MTSIFASKLWLLKKYRSKKFANLFYAFRFKNSESGSESGKPASLNVNEVFEGENKDAQSIQDYPLESDLAEKLEKVADNVEKTVETTKLTVSFKGTNETLLVDTADKEPGEKAEILSKQTNEITIEVGTKIEKQTLTRRREFDERTAEALHRRQEEDKKYRLGGEVDPGLG